MLPQEIQDGDYVVLRDGRTVQVGPHTLIILNKYYTDELKCPGKPEFDIMQVKRVSYDILFQSAEIDERNNKHVY